MAQNRIVSFGSLYTYRGDYDNSVLIYNFISKQMLHYSNVEGLCVESGVNYCDRREAFSHDVIIFNKEQEHLFPIFCTSEFNLANFNQIGSVYQTKKYKIPDNAPISEIKTLIEENDNKGWAEVKNGLGKKLGYINSLFSVEIIPASNFYSEENPLTNEEEYSGHSGYSGYSA